MRLRSTTAVRRPARAIWQANSLPPWPLPRIRMSTCSEDTSFLRVRPVLRVSLLRLPSAWSRFARREGHGRASGDHALKSV
jgi:hypothetical protein